MKALLKIAVGIVAAVALTAPLVHADGMQVKPQQAKPVLQATGMAKPPVCAQGFTPVGMKLQQHEGKKWYEYTCAREEVINRVCNADTQVIDVKDNFISLPSDGKSKKSKLQMSYKCFNYVPVE